MNEIARIIIFSGVMLVIAGIVLLIIQNTTGMPKLPGDIFIRRGNFTFYFPIVTSILISIVLTVIVNLFFRR